MTARTTVTGNLGRDAELRWTPSGSPVLDLNIAATPRKLDKNTDRWDDDGDPLWISAGIWGQQAESLAEAGLTKGVKVTVEGTLRLRGYDRREGGRGQALELVGAKFLGVVPKGRAGSAPQRSQEAAGGAYGGGQYTGQGQQFTQPQTGAQSADVWGANGPVPF